MVTMQWIAVDALKPNARNARTHSKKQIRQIADSIAAFGFLVPILIDEGGVIIAGHGRYAAAILLGLQAGPGRSGARACRKPNDAPSPLPTTRSPRMPAGTASCWPTELPELAEILVVEGLDISITGFAPVEIDQIATDFEEDPSDPADTVDPEWTNGAPVTKPGDLWELGHHRLLCGDARNADDLARLMGDSRAAMAFLDPPYNVRVRDIVGRGQIKHSEFAMASGELSRAGFVEFLESTAWRRPRRCRATAPSISCAWTGAISANCSRPAALAYDETLNLVVWVKINAGQGSFYRSQHELIGVFRVGKAAASQQHRARAPRPFALQRLALCRRQHVSGGPPGRAEVPSDRQAGRAGGRCHQGLHPSRRHRARHLLWLRHDHPGGRARRPTGLHARDRAPLCRRRHQALAGLFTKGCHSRRHRPDLRRTHQQGHRRDRGGFYAF